jgi:two-component system, cell cycle response regulator
LTPNRILVVAADPSLRRRTTDLFVTRGFGVTSVDKPPDSGPAGLNGDFDLMVVFLGPNPTDGLNLVRTLRSRQPEQEILLIGDHETASAALAAMRAGAAQYLPATVDDASLAFVAERCLERAAVRRERTQLLGENREFIRNQALYRRCLDLLSTLDLERLQEAVLAELCAVCDAQSGALWIADNRGTLVLRAYRGLIDRPRLVARIDPKNEPFAEGIQGRVPFPPPDTANTDRGPGSSFYVPLLAGGETVGLALVADKLRGNFSLEDHQVVRALGDFAATAMRNARRYQALERLGLRDKDTAAYNLAYFVDYAGKEIYKARRYGRTFSLLTLAVDNFDAVRKEHGADPLRAVTRSVLGGLSRVTRDADVVAKASEGEFYVLLPETDHFGSVMFQRRALAVARNEIALKAGELSGQVRLVAGNATFPVDGEDFDELVHQARMRLGEAKASLTAKLVLDGLDFWTTFDLLLGGPGSPPLPQVDSVASTRRGQAPAQLFSQIQYEAGREIARNPGARGVVYVGGIPLDPDLPIVTGLEHAPHDAATRVLLLGRRVATPFAAHANVTAIYLDGDERLTRGQFLFMSTDTASYAYLQRPGEGGQPAWAFHTSDSTLADALVDRIETAYDLQPF